MAKRTGGFIGHDGLNAPDSVTGVSATGGNEEATVSFTAPTDTGGSSITSYHVQDSTGAHSASGSSSPVTVTGLTNGTSYTFNVWAINSFGYSEPSDATGSVTPNVIPYAIFAGDDGGERTTMDYVTITTLGNAADFGDLATGQELPRGASSSTRGLFFGGHDGSNFSNVIQYITPASTGNATDFGDMTQDGMPCGAGNNDTRAVAGGRHRGASGQTNVIDYVTIASTGNATDFGDRTVTAGSGFGFSSTTRTCFGMGYAGSAGGINNIDYITTASTGNATDFGDAVNGYEPAGASNNTRGIICQRLRNGTRYGNIYYITIASTGNVSTFGNLSANT